MKHFTNTLTAIFLTGCLSAQEADYRSHLGYSSKRQVFVNYENDLFFSTDEYYTQGLSFAYKTPVKDPTGKINRLFIGRGSHSMAFGADQLCFNPTSIKADSVLPGDRPYAATIRLNVLFETTDSSRNNSFSWMISAGIIGKEALGKEMQTGIHRATNNPLPQGWHHQLRTGLLLDLNLYAQRELLASGSWLILTAEGSAWIGTSRIQASAGPRLQLQFMNRRRSLSFGAYINPAVTFIGYDGTLQGSLISRKSEYVIQAGDVERAIFGKEYGAFIRIGNFELSAAATSFTASFKNSGAHSWGGIRMSVYF